jgi:hypothetical protein
MTHMTAPHRIFLSYRRGDTAGHVGRLYDELVRYFGKARVFMDIDGIAPGEDFVNVLDARLRDAAVVLVVIGPRWAGVDAEGRRRLDNPNDFVRLEVTAALRRADVALVPVLCDGAEMPAEGSLPEPLTPLARRNAMVVSDLRWQHDVRQLVAAIERHVPFEAGVEGGLLTRVPRRVWVAAGLLLLLWIWGPWRTPSISLPSTAIPKAIDRTPPKRLLRDATRERERARDDWSDDAELVYLAVDCQSTWTGCLTTLSFRSEKKGAGLYATYGATGSRWNYQPSQYPTGFRVVPLKAIDLDEALRAASAAGLVGPVNRITLEAPRQDLGRADGQWVIEPADRERSGRVRFCVNARTAVVDGC